MSILTARPFHAQESFFLDGLGWKVAPHSEMMPYEFDPLCINSKPYPHEPHENVAGGYIPAEESIQRLEMTRGHNEILLGADHAQFFLEHQETAPESLRKIGFHYFDGTKLISPTKKLEFSLSLFYDGKEFWPGNSWRGYARAGKYYSVMYSYPVFSGPTH